MKQACNHLAAITCSFPPLFPRLGGRGEQLGPRPVLALLLLLVCGPAFAGPPHVYKAARIWTGTGPPIVNGVLVVRDGKVVEAGRMTVYHNGVKIHDAVRLAKKSGEIVTNTTAGLGGDPCTAGPIMLQDHGNPVQFRNIWLVPTK